MKGIDIYQGDGYPLNPIPQKAYNESDFCIVKATQGVSYKHTDYFHKMIVKVLKDKKLAGAYHYAGGNDPIKEADYFISVVKSYIGSIILALDWESMQNKAWGSKTWCKDFIDRVKEKTDVTCFLYVNNEGLKQCDNLCGKVPLWFAGFPTDMNSWVVPHFKYNLGKWKNYKIWQFTSSHEKVDRNISYLTVREWKDYAFPDNLKPKATQSIPVNTLQLVADTLAGKYGNGETRKKKLGTNYNAVMSIINHITTAPIDTLAKETIDGKYGNGAMRKKVLGSKYTEVQKRVNQLT